MSANNFNGIHPGEDLTRKLMPITYQRKCGSARKFIKFTQSNYKCVCIVHICGTNVNKTSFRMHLLICSLSLHLLFMRVSVYIYVQLRTRF